MNQHLCQFLTVSSPLLSVGAGDPAYFRGLRDTDAGQQKEGKLGANSQEEAGGRDQEAARFQQRSPRYKSAEC